MKDHNEAIEKIEALRLDLMGLHRQMGSTQNHLDHGRPAPDLEKELRVRLKEMKDFLTEKKNLYKEALKRLREDQPSFFQAWVGSHQATVDEIISSPPPDDKKLTEKIVPAHLHTVRKTATEWQEVLDGKRDSVHINWYYLPDYEERLKKRAEL